MKLKITAFLLALILLVACFAGCTNEKTDEPAKTDASASTAKPDSTEKPGSSDSVTDGPTNTDGTTPTETTSVVTLPVSDTETEYIKDSIPDSLKYDNKTVTALAWKDHTMTEFESPSDSPNAEPIDDALLLRNGTVEQRLGVKLEFVYEPGNGDNMSKFIQKIEADATSEKLYDYIGQYSRVAPALALRGLVCDLNELQYMEFDKPWWPATLVDQATIGDSLYFCTGDISTNLLWMMQATFYNKNLITVYNLEDPYELVLDGEWTFDKFYSMCENKYSDTGDGQKTIDDMYGFTIYENNIDDYQISADLHAAKNIDGKLTLTGDFTGQAITDLIESLQKFLATDDVYHEAGASNPRSVFFEERAVFMTDRVFVIAGKDNSSHNEKIEFEYGVVPNPKLNKAQKEYCTNIGHPFTMYTVPSYQDEATREMSGAVLECLASEGYRTVTPQVFEVVMKVKYAYGDDSSRMFDLIRNTTCFEVGRLFAIGNGETYFTASAFRLAVLSGKSNWVSTYKAQSASINADIKAINEKLAQ